jgi:hypothetical protein
MDERPQTDDTRLPVLVKPIPRLTPSPTFYGQLADGLAADLDRFSANVPGFDDETVQPEFVRRKRRIPRRFVQRAVGALFGSSELLAVEVLDAAETMDDQQYIDAMQPVERKLFAVWKRLRFTIQVREARLARKAQQIYGVAKELARDRETSTIQSHVDEMAKFRSQKKRRRTTPDEVPADPEPE